MEVTLGMRMSCRKYELFSMSLRFRLNRISSHLLGLNSILLCDFQSSSASKCTCSCVIRKKSRFRCNNVMFRQAVYVLEELCRDDDWAVRHSSVYLTIWGASSINHHLLCASTRKGLYPVYYSLTVWLLAPMLYSLSTNLEWTLSKVFLKLKTTASTSFLLSRRYETRDVSPISWLSQLCPFLNPCWWWVSFWLFFRYVG